MSELITIRNQSKKTTEIRIEGIIGIAEKTQFDDPQERISTYEAFQNALRQIRRIKAETVIVNIRSTGGNVNDALLIHDALSSLEGCQIVTRCYGYIASAATIIAQAATKGCREISKNALYLIHQASSSAEGNAGELVQTADLLGKTDERIAQVYAAASGREVEPFIALMRENSGNGRWLSPEEVIREGLADKVIAPAKITNQAQETLLKMNLPEIPSHLLPPTHAKGWRKQWNALLERLSVEIAEKQADTATVAETFTKPSPAPSNREDTAELEEEIARCENPEPSAAVQEIADLQNRIVELETLNAKLRAKATQTLPKEDPSNREIKRYGNAAAYESDMKNFIKS
ncbi:MAG: ATP-dependent Clp protease proteolytic subunit [Rikenellaceae bacterium]|jgi:ATP-dependent protease ClpP protease subunit|nr:ATP-dependent Clp protease proteolytic subunit [Rikenellaceae bacterium]